MAAKVKDAVHSLQSRAPPSKLTISAGTLTSKWFEKSDYVQIIEMVLTNNDPESSFIKKDNLTITASSDSFDIVRPATVTRLMAGQQIVVQIGVKNKPTVVRGVQCSGTITATWANTMTASTPISGECGFGDYAATKESLNRQWTPDWYNNAKFGIFIHWGVYAVPAYGNQGANEDYAEWYWKRMGEPDYKSKTYQYHRDTYGENFNYDDFIANFTGSKFDAAAWVNLIADAGAKYMVPVTKHHDGFALFDTKETSNRNSVKLGPKRDFIAELISAAKKLHPEIRRGTYFSMPEWFSPAYAPYALGCCGGFPGGPPTNPYTSKVIDYTGYISGKEYVTEIQYPQMETLAYDERYETELMWCDIGGANNATTMLSAWINWARSKGRQITYNNRCGYGSTDHTDATGGDFTTPEYVTNGDTVVSKWETNRGMDPFSFGYNKDTPDSSYLTGKDIVQSLVDVVSKNGNFLLDIGPKADGTIPEIMQTGLQDAGRWIKERGESIYDTRFWQTTSGTGNFRYTISDSAFYIHLLAPPVSPGSITIPDKIPFLSGDEIRILGGAMNNTYVPAILNTDGTVRLDVPANVAHADRWVWTFKVIYKL
ncbi:glycoside hydrolase family 29 protein [Exserohilum turcica Et28A]|uniref:alpha-L-fucosidase n=1 Tax=Exserohilum turcicum (strain 28A) TaxID=671987 RepID=R0JY44_EXST2|nr:glycoside hydrolase family 29 protein [Exserohilum turcica Et28A]EOA81137.1 glycoside hydrolase family 29 protein [Exserohilum turcica Et28A]